MDLSGKRAVVTGADSTGGMGCDIAGLVREARISSRWGRPPPAISGHVRRAVGKRRVTWYAKYRAPDSPCRRGGRGEAPKASSSAL
jgi:hypothetical protein